MGAIGCMIGLPVTIYGLFIMCNEDYCWNGSQSFKMTLQWSELFNWSDLLLICAWVAFQITLERFLPGPFVAGVPLPTGQRLRYKINGHLAFWVTLAVVAFGKPVFDDRGHWIGQTNFPVSYVYDHFIPLATGSMIVSFCLSVFLFVYSYVPSKKLLSQNGQSPNELYNFFIGRELNPRIGTFDLKYFCELRPGLIGWVVLNLGMVAKQYELDQTVSPSMMLCTAFQLLYVWDALFYEECILTTMDITTDGFGFMLAFGDLSWVPFVYSLQARYLVDYDPKLSTITLALIFGLQCVGYMIFRGANAQKNAFRTDPKSNPRFKYMDTRRGTKLLVSGWWGMARKINYTGDWLMSLAWCSLCGTTSIIPYFYAIYFAILLIHRALRDNEACSAKYGEDWNEYKRRVPYVFIPHVF